MSRNGIQWQEENGKVSTMVTGKKIWAAAARGCGEEELAKGIEKEKNWRNGYVKHCVGVADAQTKGDAEAFKSAEEGLKEAYNVFEFGREGKAYKLTEMDKVPVSKDFATTEFQGEGEVCAELEVPLNDEILKGTSLTEKTLGWANYGSMEPSCHSAISEIAGLSTSERSAILADKIFVLLGATSAAGPAMPLLKMGGCVAAVARPGKKLETLIDDAKQTSGTLLVPTIDDKLGADVLTQVPEIINWCCSLPSDKTLVIGSYIYLDGEAHVRASIASDLIGQGVVKARKGTILAYLGSPSIAHSFAKEAHQDAAERYDSAGLLWKVNPMRLCKYVKNSRPIAHNGVPVTDGLVVFQGPNYALAKTLQSWRAILCRSPSHATTVSINLAPPMYTDSICHVPAAMAALNGFQAFPPLAAFHPDTMSPILAAMLLWDISSPKSTARPEAPLTSATEVFVQNAFHGGSWRCPYNQESIGSSIFVLGKCWYTRPPKTPPTK
eukprot:TRINITY_DN1269_c0_g1_i1.p1 TRINITY_DN1269_c0_g1~~TRINITY_DN1269_c0_g1_i1.p1  ORF type:complete len:516 (+),score=133.27 TRINITY_DN1269_c0_g1_i1:63-1550(+)